jgi:catalase
MKSSNFRRGARLALLTIASTTAPMLVIGAPAPGTEVNAPQMIDAFEGTFGVHPGQRRNHIKGTCAAGDFVGTADAAALSRSILFSGKTIPVIARFSLGGGSPEVPDGAPAPRGMALEFHPPGGALQHITMINVPIFAAASPASFRDAILAAKPDPKTGHPDPEKLKAYAATHPDAMALTTLASHHTPTANYYQTTYFSIHTFKFIDAKGTEHLVKWRFIPRDGTKEMTAAEMQAAPHDFLEKNLIERTRKGPAVWDMIVYVGEPGDPQDNPTLAWPETRKHFTAGTLNINQATAQQKGMACEPINFDPLVMADGIAPTNDPILLFRSPAYAVSFAKRLSGQ